MSPADHSSRESARGLAAALAAYLIWGLAPLYFHALAPAPPLVILAHRVVWSVLVLALVLTGVRRWEAVLAILADRRKLLTLALTTALISVNWGLFIWAIHAGRLLEASLGYFVNPLVNVALGAIFLRERLTRPQLAAVALAGTGVALLVARLGTLPWVALALAITFGFYALLRKKAQVDALGGLLVETALLAPLALAYLAARAAAGAPAFGGSPRMALLLSAAGVVTATPLVLFAAGVRRLRLATMGLVQYVAPTAQFLLAVFAFHEPFGAGQAGAFALIWAALAVYTGEAVARARAAPATPPAGAAARRG